MGGCVLGLALVCVWRHFSSVLVLTPTTNQHITPAKSTWDLQAVIVKSNDDVRQEVFIMQLIAFYEEVFKQNGVGIWLRPYKIMSTGNSTGLIAVRACVPVSQRPSLC